MNLNIRTRARVLSHSFAAVLLAGSLSTHAFDVPVHIRITNEALGPLRVDVFGASKGFSPKALEQIADANESVDSIATGSAAIWHPERHFTNEDYRNSNQRIIDLRREIIQRVTSSSPDGQGARERLGWALHTLQDFYAHSNWVERGNSTVNYALGKTELPNPARGNSNCPDDANVLGPAGGGTLTSGYFVGFTLSRNTFGCDVEQLPENKCFHGNYTVACPGINKDLDAAGAAQNGVPQNPHHGASAQQARQATRMFTQGIVDELKGNDKALAALLDVKGTLGFVVDDTGSMGSSINGVVGAINQIVDATSSNPELQPNNYLLVRFGDPDVGGAMVTDDAAQLRNAVASLHAHGGGDCPELSQSALISAIDAAATDSRLYLFSDATAKDSSTVNQVIARAQIKGTELNYGLTGSCSPIDPAYLRGAAETGGQVFRVTPSEIPKLFTIIQSQLKGNLTTIAKRHIDLGAGGSNKIAVPVDSQMSTLLVALSAAENNVPARHTVRVFRPSGAEVSSSDLGVSIVTLSTGAIVRIKAPEAGQWMVQVVGYGPFTASVLGNSPLDIDRFDFVEPGGDIHGGFDSIPGQPVADAEMLAEATLTGDFASTVFAFIDESGVELGRFALSQRYPTANPYHFLGAVNLPSVPFRVAVQGVDGQGRAFRREYPALYRSQPIKVAVEGLSVVGLGAGEEKVISFSVENLGARATFGNLARDERGFVASVVPATTTLETGEKAVVSVTLGVPQEASDGATSQVVFTATDIEEPYVYNSASSLVQVLPNRAPRCVAPMSQLSIWSPNGQFRDIDVATIAQVVDPDGDAVEIDVTSVTQDEPVGRTRPDAESADNGVVRLRAERLGAGSGRVYQVNYVASDAHGASCEGYAHIAVPHDQSDSSAVNDGQAFDSMSP